MDEYKHILIARRIRRRLGGQTPGDLRLRVALEADRDGRRLPESTKAAVVSLVRDDAEGRFPLPTRGGCYSRVEWTAIRFQWTKSYPPYRAAAQRIASWERTLRAEIGTQRFAACFRVGGPHPNSALVSTAESFSHDLGRVAINSRTPTQLRAEAVTFEGWIANVLNATDRLSPPRLYDPRRRPDELVDELRGTSAQFYVEPLLRGVFDIRFGSRVEGEPSFYHVLNGKGTVAQVIEARTQHQAAFEVERRRWALAYSSEALKVAQLLRRWYTDGDDPHLATLNRRLAEHRPGFRFDRVITSGTHALCLSLSGKGFVYGPGTTKRRAAAAMLQMLFLFEAATTEGTEDPGVVHATLDSARRGAIAHQPRGHTA